MSRARSPRKRASTSSTSAINPTNGRISRRRSELGRIRSYQGSSSSTSPGRGSNTVTRFLRTAFRWPLDRHKSIPVPPDGQDPTRAGGILFDLLAQPADVDVYGARVHGEIVAPHLAQEGVAREDDAGMPGE